MLQERTLSTAPLPPPPLSFHCPSPATGPSLHWFSFSILVPLSLFHSTFLSLALSFSLPHLRIHRSPWVCTMDTAVVSRISSSSLDRIDHHASMADHQRRSCRVERPNSTSQLTRCISLSSSTTTSIYRASQQQTSWERACDLYISHWNSEIP